MSGVCKKIDQGVNWISTVFLWGSAIANFLMSLICFLDVIFRYFLNEPISGAQELVQFSMAAFVFLGMGMAARRGRLTKVPLFLDMMKPAMRNFFQAGGSFICCAASALFCRQLMLSAISYYSKTSVTAPTLGVPYWPFYLLGSIGCGLMAAEMLIRGIKEVQAGRAARRQTEVPEQEVTQS